MQQNEFRKTAALLCCFFLAAVVAGCRPKPPGLPVQFIVPDGYRGTFSIILDKNTWQSIPVVNGSYVVTVPANGKVFVSSFDFLQGKHRTEAREKSSESVFRPADSPNSVSLRFVDYNVDKKTLIWMIGTEQDVEKARKEL